MARLAILGSRGIPAQYGGFEVAAERIALGLVKRGWHVTVFCPHYQTYRQRSYEGIRLRFVWHPPGGIGSLLYDGLSLVIASAMRLDAILMFGYGASPFLLVPRVVGVPVVVNTDGLEWKRSKWAWPVKLYFKFAERVVSMMADGLISDAQGIRRHYREKYGVDSEYIAYGTDVPDTAASDVSQYGLRSRQYYLVLMRLEPENSILEIVQGYLASRASRSLVLVGTSSPFFERKVRPLLNGQERVRFVGPIYDRKRVAAMRLNAFAYVHGHSVGGTNPSLLEAMACANFVIAKDVEFNREVLGGLGRYFATADDLMQILNDLEQADPGMIQRTGEAGRAIVETQFKWESVVDAYARVVAAAMARVRGAQDQGS